MTTFAEHFGLADPHRRSFELSPEHDASLFIDDQNTIVPWLRGKLIPEDLAPQIVVRGDFGTGKSHVLRFIEKKLGPELGFRSIYLELDGFGRRSTFFDLHIRVMGSLIDVLKEILLRLPRPVEFSQGTQGLLNQEMTQALKALADPTTQPSLRALYEAWLIGSGPTPTQARQRLSFSGRLFERAGPSALVNLWKSIGRLHHEVTGQALIVLMDEGESFGRIVTPDAQAAMGSGLRTLFDADNRSLGITLGLNTPQSREGLHPMLRSDVQGRLTGKELGLQPLRDPDRVHSFVIELWKRLRAKNGPRDLLTQDALAFVSQKLVALRNVISLHQRALAPIPTQRDLMRVLAFLGERAFSNGIHPPLSRDHLMRWFQVDVT